MGPTTIGGDTILDFAPGGSFTVTGGLATVGNPNVLPSSVMLSGQFTGITTLVAMVVGAEVLW
jgi:hypothetical protein